MRLHVDGVSIDDALSLYDISASPHGSCMENIYGRGRAVALLKATFYKMTLTNSDGQQLDGWDDLFIPMLSQLIVGLQAYYDAAFQGQEDSDDEEEGQAKTYSDFDVPSCDLFPQQLQWSAFCWPELHKTGLSGGQC